MKAAVYILVLSLAIQFSCGSDDLQSRDIPVAQNPNPVQQKPIRYLALGDSYTIGQNVCETCRFPEQLRTALQNSFPDRPIDLQIIAATGWTTSNLKTAIETANPAGGRDLVTLLIGVNNQYQHKAFSLYESEFPELVATAISLAKGDKDNVIVVSIPDYAFTPYGQNAPNPQDISNEIEQYNAFAAEYCASINVKFASITDITQMGVENPALVATDGLHPSQLAYALFVERILPRALETLP